ncbi:hypothetical protein [Paenibacillus glucanolyticus]|nr:hypothetical protein [Paenibacillus glucanolyticus]
MEMILQISLHDLYTGLLRRLHFIVKPSHKHFSSWKHSGSL